MALIYADRVQETTTTTGTGTYALAGASTGYQAFSVVGNANTCYYAATDGINWEVGLGTYTLSGTTLARTSIMASSNGGAAVSWAVGVKTIWLDYPASVIAGVITAVSVATANGFAGSSSGGATPALTLSTDQTGVLAGNGTSMTGRAITGTSGRIGVTNGTGASGNPTIDLAAAPDVRDYLDTAPYVADRTALAALDTTKDTVAYLKENGREGWFEWNSANLSTQVTADTQQGLYVAPASAPTGASGAWVRSGFSSTDINALWFGVLADDSTDNLTAVNAMLAAVAGYRIRFPKGAYRFSSGWNSITANNTVIVGEGDFNNGTVFRFANTTGDDITFSGCQDAGIEDIYFASTTAIKTSGYPVKFTASAFRCFARRVRTDYSYGSINIRSSTECRIQSCSARYLLGPRAVYFDGAVGAGSYRAIIDDFNGDNPYTYAYGSVGNWATSTAYTQGAIRIANSKIWQCSTSGTSAGAGTGPSSIPAAGLSAFTTPVVDGTAAWVFVCDSSLTWIDQGNYAYSLVIDKAACINGARGFRMSDDANTGTSYPIWSFIWDLEADHAYTAGVQLSAGEGCGIDGSWIGSTLNGNGMVIGTAWRAEARLQGSRVMGNAQAGILLQAAPVDTIIQGNFIGDNSASSAGTYHGITVAAGATQFQIIGNSIGDLIGGAGNNQGYGILVSSGASDDFIITNNNLTGNTLAGLADGSTGFNKQVNDNIGVYQGAVVEPRFQRLAADRTGSDVNTAQAVFDAASDALFLDANTTYEFEALYYITRAAGTTSHTTGVLFGGTATLTMIDYVAQVTNPTGNVLANVQQIMGTAATEVVLTAANTSATENLVIDIRGRFVVTASGSIIPQFKYSAAPGGAPSIKRGTMFAAWPMGNNSLTKLGNWA